MVAVTGIPVTTISRYIPIGMYLLTLQIFVPIFLIFAYL